MPITSVIPNLPVGTSVDVRVRAFNQAGFGPYSATQTLSTGAPPPPPPPPPSSQAAVDWITTTGKTLPKTAWGFRSSIFGQNFANATFRNTANTFLKPASICINPDWELDRKVASGDVTDFNNLVPFINSFCQSGVRIIMGVARFPTDGTAATLASRAVSLANYCNANGFSNILDWDVGVLWMDDGGLGNGLQTPQATVNTYYNTIFDALKGVNPNYKIWGPAQWHPGVGANSSFASAVGAARAPNVSVSWMSFPVNPQNGPVGVPIVDSLTTAYGPKGYNSGDALTQRNALSGTVLANAPIGVFDWNMSEFANETGYYMGGVYAALYIMGLFKSTTGLDVCVLENINNMGIIGAIGNPAQGGSNSNVTAFGYVLGKAGQSVFGTEVASSSTFSDLAIVALKPTTGTGAIMLVNFNLTTNRTINLGQSGSAFTGTIARWEIGKSSTGAPQQPVPTIGTQASMASISVPSETVVILTGSLASAPGSVVRSFDIPAEWRGTAGPAQVGTPTLGSATNTSIAVTWPALTGTPPTGYTVQYKRAADPTYTNAPNWLESPNGTVIGVNSGSIRDKNNNVFTINGAGQVVINGIIDNVTSSVDSGEYWAHQFWQHSAGLAPRPEAVAAGFTTQVVREDFNSASAVSTSGPGSIATFYTNNPFGTQELTSSDFHVSGSAVTITNSYADYAYSLSTVAGPNAAKSQPGAIRTNTGSGVAYRYGYFEASIKFDASTVDNVGGQPAWWATALQGNFGGTGGDGAEIDVMECFSTNINDAGGGVINWLDPSHYFNQGGITVAAYVTAGGYAQGIQASPSPALVASSGQANNVYMIYSLLWQPGRIRMWRNTAARRAANGYASDVLMQDFPTNQTINCALSTAGINQFVQGQAMFTGCDGPQFDFFILATGANTDLSCDYFYAWQ